MRTGRRSPARSAEPVADRRPEQEAIEQHLVGLRTDRRRFSLQASQPLRGGLGEKLIAALGGGQ